MALKTKYNPLLNAGLQKVIDLSKIIEYENDVSSSYTDRSIPDKGYIDTELSNTFNLDSVIPMSAGVVASPVITDNGDGTIGVGDCIVNLYSDVDFNSPLKRYSVGANTTLSLIDNTINYICVDYNGGTPIITLINDVELITESTIVPILTIYRVGTQLSYISWAGLGTGLNNKLHQRIVKTNRFAYESGLILSEQNNREVIITSGKSWHGAIRKIHSAFNSSIDEFVHWYPVAGYWVNNTVTEFTNTLYNDGSDLQTLTSGFYTTVNVYRTESDTLKAGFVLGNKYVSLAEAENAPIPDIPINMTNLGIFIGRFVIRGGDTNSTSALSAFNLTFSGTAITNHNNLSGLQGGTIGDYNHLSSSQINDLSSVTTSFVDKHKNGFLLSDILTTGSISFDEVNREFTIAPQVGQDNFQFYSDSVKYSKTATESIIISDTTGTHFIYYDSNGVLKETSSFYGDLILKECLVGLVYWNASTGYSVLVANERHGSDMGGVTHLSKHLTDGALYSSGMDITGLADGVSTFTQVTSGVFFDEDIQHNVQTKTTMPKWYRLGVLGEWYKTDADNLIGYNGGTGDTYWNEFTGTTWQLTRSKAATDYIPYHVFVTNDITNPYIVLIGQSAYSSRNGARAAIEDEIRKVKADGLPTPEFVHLYSYIVRRNGLLEDLADGSTYVDYRVSSVGIGGTSPTVSSHSDLTNLDADDHLQYKLIDGRSTDIHTITSADSPYDAGSNGETVILADKTSGDIEIVLPSCLGQYRDGYIKVISSTKNTNKIIVTTVNSDTIDGNTNKDILVTNTSLHFKSDGISNYNILSSKDINIYTLELGSATGIGTAPTLYANIGAGVQRSFSSTTTNGISWNKHFEGNYNGEDLLLRICGLLYNTAPIATSKIVLEVKVVFVKADGTEDIYTATGQTITEIIDVSSYNADSTYIFTIPTPITGVKDAKAVMINLYRLGGNVDDTYNSTFDMFGANLIKT